MFVCFFLRFSWFLANSKFPLGEGGAGGLTLLLTIDFAKSRLKKLNCE